MAKVQFGNRAWSQIQEISPKSYTCGHCGEYISSDRGYQTQNLSTPALIYCCSNCGRPTLFDQDGSQIPGPKFGSEVSDISDATVEALYNEARKCIGVEAYTSSVLTSRTLLMQIAVAKGAEPNQSFKHYVKFLSDKYVPMGLEWVDHIRDKGNDATHEIPIMEKDDATVLLSFLEVLLKIIYEFPSKVKQRPD